MCFHLTTTQKWNKLSKVTGHSVTLWRKNRHSETYLPHHDWNWVTNSHFPPLSPGSALRRFQWHAEDQLQGEWGLPDRGLESRPDQNEMNIQSEAKPHGLICPFTMAVIILRVSSAAPPPRWEGSLAESESSSFGCGEKKKVFVGGGGWERKEKKEKSCSSIPQKEHMKVFEKQGGGGGARAVGGVNPGENNRFKHVEGEISRRRACRTRFNNPGVWGRRRF